jgi:hypothetical protein
MSHPLHLMLPLYIINSLEVEGACVAPSEHPAYLAPALCMIGLLSVVFSGISCCTQLRFPRQVHVGGKTRLCLRLSVLVYKMGCWRHHEI